MKPWFKNLIPHQDIRDGVLDESVFAADLAEVASGIGRAVYTDADIFFSKTFFTAGLKTICKRVIDGLNGETDSGDRVISLQTGFGGGKTHSLISLFHIAKQGKLIEDIEQVQDLLKITGPVNFDKGNIAVFTNKTCDPIKGRKTNGVTLKTIWGEIAWQLGGKEAYDIIRENDEKQICPKGIFKDVIKKCSPALILIDELADYCVSAAALTIGKSTLSDQTVSFIQELSEAVSGSSNCVLVATLPASAVEVASSQIGGHILNSLSNRLSRVSADTNPVSDEEIFEVIRRRLFEKIEDKKIVDTAVKEYKSLYNSVGLELPSHATKTEYRERLKKAYPFHPALIDVFYTRWASHHDFQRTRGVLRLLAAIVSDLWKRQKSLTGDVSFIHISDVNLENLDPLTSQLKKLYGNGYDAVVSADISGSSSNAFRIDTSVKEYGSQNVTQGIAVSILLYSFGTGGTNKGLSIDELKLAVLRPDGFNHNSVNGALDRLENSAYYLYYSTAGTTSKRYWFHTKPNINILINKSKGDVKKPEVQQEILNRLNNRASNVNSFNVLVAPSGEIPEQKSPTIVIVHPRFQVNGDNIDSSKAGKHITNIATKKGNGERIYRNTLLFLICTEIGYTKLQNDIIEYLACTHIRDEYQSQLESDQKADIKSKIETTNQAIDRGIVNAYSVVAKNCVKKGIQTFTLKQFKEFIDRQIESVLLDNLTDEEWILPRIGFNELKRNNLIPTPENNIKVRDVYESFLRYDDKPMIYNLSVIQDSLLRYCEEGEICITSGKPPEFTKIFYREQVPFFDVTDNSYWLVDKSFYKVQEVETTGTDNVLTGRDTTNIGVDADTGKMEERQKTGYIEKKSFKTITIRGKVAMENWPQIFQSFIQPLKNNKVSIEIEISARSTETTPIGENTQNYKITKESASQLGLTFEAD